MYKKLTPKEEKMIRENSQQGGTPDRKSQIRSAITLGLVLLGMIFLCYFVLYATSF
jgi:hypothetical protein